MRAKTVYRLWLTAVLGGLLYTLTKWVTMQPVSLAERNASPTAPAVFNEAERNSLEKLFRKNLMYLLFVLAASLLISILLVQLLSSKHAIWISIATGILGSATAAFISCLDRHANGLEDSRGNQSPIRQDKVGRFNRGMYYWFLARPILGAVTGAVAYWGVLSGIFTPGSGSAVAPEGAAFYGFLAGLLAKSLLDVLKGLLSNIFKS